MPTDEGVRPAAPGHPHGELQSPQVSVLADTSRITEVIPEKKLAFRVNENGTIWSYELEPTDTGTRLTETRHAENGVKPVSNMAVNALMGGVPSCEAELVKGMNQSLARIKAAAES
jgi:hypothetical protein